MNVLIEWFTNERNLNAVSLLYHSCSYLKLSLDIVYENIFLIIYFT